MPRPYILNEHKGGSLPYFSHNGKRLFYREAGVGPLLVILHGNTASSACHEDDIAYFAKRFHVVAPDFVGCGRSERVKPWPKHWWIESANAAVALVEHVDEGPAVFLGTSGGAIAAILAAANHGDKVRAVIADSFGRRWTPEDIDAVLADRRRLTFGQMTFWQKAHGDDWHEVVESDSSMIASWHDTGIDFFEGCLGNVKCPVLLTGSLADNLVPRIGEQLRSTAAEIPDCRLELLGHGDHPAMWSCEEEFRRAADAFLRAVPA